MQGRIYTTFFDRVESKLDNDANRLQMLPTLTAEDDLKMGECHLFLKEDDGLTELNLPRVKTSGNDGFIRCLANATEPGLYNITYNTQARFQIDACSTSRSANQRPSLSF